jgi:hypothetical protein
MFLAALLGVYAVWRYWALVGSSEIGT